MPASAASAWVRRWSHLVRPGGVVLDVACGQGRHLAWFAALGHPVVGVDRSQEALDAVAVPPAQCQSVCADIEQGPWPFAERQFDAVVVTNYLWRPLLPQLARSLAPGGVLICETFALGQETIGRPSRPEFLLKPGELLQAFAALRTVAFEDGFEPPAQADSPGRFVQRIAAIRAGDAPCHALLKTPAARSASE
jgi:SAM-dependent methyltransferase